MNKYETTFILEPGLDDNRLNEEIEKISSWITDLGGQVLDVQRWGKRRLSYEIQKKRDGIYTMVLHESPGPVVREIERRLKLDESVLRVLSVLHVPVEVPPVAEGETVAAAAAEEADE